MNLIKYPDYPNIRMIPREMKIEMQYLVSVSRCWFFAFFGNILKVYVSKYFLERNLKVSVTFSKKYLYQSTLNRSVLCSRNVEST